MSQQVQSRCGGNTIGGKVHNAVISLKQAAQHISFRTFDPISQTDLVISVTLDLATYRECERPAPQSLKGTSAFYDSHSPDTLGAAEPTSLLAVRAAAPLPRTEIQ